MANKLVVNADSGKYTINKNIYGHFAEHLGRCIYEGIWVGEESPIPNTRGIRNDVVEALRKLNPPVLRWPGGCFADEYHWVDGIGQREKRSSMLNVHWGGVTENNHFGTHEFFDLCEQIGADPYICGNVGSGTVQEMRQWVEYMTFDGQSPMADMRRQNGREEPWKLPYLGVGNENWGCGGSMRPEYYADLYRQYQGYVRDFSGNKVNKIACGPYGSDYHWTEVMMREVMPIMAWSDAMYGLSLHWYSSHAVHQPATGFDEAGWFHLMKQCLAIDELIQKHSEVMDRYDPEKRVGLIVDEWGAWYEVEPGTNPGFLFQQNTLRDALVAGLTLNIFNNRCDRVRMGNIAQTINVLQSMILTEGAKMIVTPTYHVFEMYKVHQDALMLPCNLDGSIYNLNGEEIPALSASASRDNQGKTHISICNADPNIDHELECDLIGIKLTSITGRILTSVKIDAHNTFDKPDEILPSAFDGITKKGDSFILSLPAKSVVVLEIN